MDKELAAELLSIVKGTKDFVLEQTPLVLKELVAWKIGESVGFIVLGFLFALVAWWASRIEDPFENVWPAIACGICTIVAVIAISTHVFELIQLLLAPKIYLFEYLRSTITAK